VVETRSTDKTIRDSWYWTVLKVTVFILVYFASELVFYQFTDNSPLLPWHPSIGIAFAIGFLGHPAYIIPIVFSDLLARTTLGGQPIGPASILYSSIFGLLIVVITKTVKRVFHLETHKISLQDTVVLAVATLLLSLLLGLSNYQLLPLNPLILPYFPVNAILFYSLREFLGIFFIGFPILAYVGMIQDPANVELETIRGFLKSIRESIQNRRGVLAEVIIVGMVTFLLIIFFGRLPGTEDLLLYTLYTIPIIYATIRFNRTVASAFFLIVFSLEMISASQHHFYLEEAIELQLISASGIVIAYVVNSFVLERHQFYVDISTGEERLLF
jgi:hypothetical protein